MAFNNLVYLLPQIALLRYKKLSFFLCYLKEYNLLQSSQIKIHLTPSRETLTLAPLTINHLFPRSYSAAKNFAFDFYHCYWWRYFLTTSFYPSSKTNLSLITFMSSPEKIINPKYSWLGVTTSISPLLTYISECLF